jgi:hypothetical protein
MLVGLIRPIFKIVAMNAPDKIASAFDAMERSLSQREFSAFMLTFALRFCDHEEIRPILCRTGQHVGETHTQAPVNS